MKIDRVEFQRVFLQKARERVELPPADSYSSSGSKVAFDQAVLALAVASAAVGGLLPAVAQEVGRLLVSPAQEEQLGASRLDTFARYMTASPRVDACWERIDGLVDSPFPAPRVVDLSLVCAEADARQMFVGAPALEGELKDDSVLTFALAHEEAHRRNRDSAGCAGLEALAECAEGSNGFQALRAGRHQNEREADRFAAEVAAGLGCNPVPILAFLLGCEEDVQHPSGLERAQAVRRRMAELGQEVPESEWNRLTSSHDARTTH